ncbi:preprotein translocase subunit SecE [Oleidesulfovibrio sp.]|uniref:preprotein translocase subunit SecE n=1 Tax=Oleidesulfovibrio sp. TaxID=2909707 RepID=UPI003A8766E2
MAKRNHKAEKASADAANTGVGSKLTQFTEFLEESKVEIRKVTWPTRKETMATSIAVLVLVFVMSLFLGIVDLGLTRIVEYILS